MELNTCMNFRLWLEAASLRVGNVGSQEFGQGGYRRFDQTHWDNVMRWLSENDVDVTNATHDFIDLNQGRDFLQEQQTYDIVILHHIYTDESQEDHGVEDYQRSPLHKKENWVQRLQNTRAKYIFVFGSGKETKSVDSDYIGSIPGYHHNPKHSYPVKHEYSPSFAVYVKAEVSPGLSNLAT